jgi:hypothetical protein
MCTRVGSFSRCECRSGSNQLKTKERIHGFAVYRRSARADSEKPNSFHAKPCRISASLRQGSNGDSHFAGFLVFGMNTIDVMRLCFQLLSNFPKLATGSFRPRNAMKDKCLSTLDVAGSIPVSRSLLFP